MLKEDVERMGEACRRATKMWFEKQEKDSMLQKANCLKMFTRRFIIDLNTGWKYLCSSEPSDSSMLFA